MKKIMVVGSDPCTRKLFDGFSNRTSQIEGLDEYFEKHFRFCRSYVRFGHSEVFNTGIFQSWRKECAKTMSPRSSRSAQGRSILLVLRNCKMFTVAGLTVIENDGVLSEGFSQKRRKTHRPDIFTPGQICWHFLKGSLAL